MTLNRNLVRILGAFTASIVIAGLFHSTNADETNGPAPLRILYLDEEPVEITNAEFKQLPRTTVTANGRDGQARRYSGVALYHLLERSMTPLGESLRGDGLRCYASVEAEDGYAVVFSLPELDPTFSGRSILLADEQDGKPLGAHNGPYRIIVPDEKRPARWVRMVKTIRIIESSPASRRQ